MYYSFLTPVVTVTGEWNDLDAVHCILQVYQPGLTLLYDLTQEPPWTTIVPSPMMSLTLLRFFGSLQSIDVTFIQ